SRDWTGETPGLLALAVLSVFCRSAELVDLGEALGGEAPGIGSVAAPIREFPHRPREYPPGGGRPGEPGGGLERLHAGKAAVRVALQAHAAPAPHLRHLVEGEDHHFAVLAHARDQLALDRGDRASLVGQRDVEHLLALAGVGETFVLAHHET